MQANPLEKSAMTTDAEKVTGEVLEDKSIDPRGHYAGEIRAGGSPPAHRHRRPAGVRIFIAFNLNRLEERLSPGKHDHPQRAHLSKNRLYPVFG